LENGQSAASSVFAHENSVAALPTEIVYEKSYKKAELGKPSAKGTLNDQTHRWPAK